MATGYFLRIGDKTTCGGQIITGDDTFKFYGSSAAREGDLVTCGKHSGTYQILGGISYVLGNNRRIAGTLDSFSSCPCKARLINSIQDCYVTESSGKSSTRTENSLTNEASTTTDSPHHIRYLCTDDNNLPLANCDYQLYLDDNQSITGITDSKGYTSWHQTKSANNLLYDLSIYRMDENKRKIYLLPLVSKQSLQSNYETLKHQTVDTDDPLITTYIVEIMLYRKNRLLTQQALKKPFRRLYTLEDLTLGKACSEKKRRS